MTDKKINYQAIFESSPDLYILLTPKLEIIGVSDQFLKSTMTQREKIIGKNIFEIFPANKDTLAADGSLKLNELFNKVLATKSTQVLPMERYDIRRSFDQDGEYEVRYWTTIVTPLLDDYGEVEVLVGQSIDVTERVKTQEETLGHKADNLLLLNEITERKRIELWLDSILNASGEGIYGLNTEGLVTYVNQAAANLLGWAKEEMIGKNMHYLTHHTKPDGGHYPWTECPVYLAFKDGQVHKVDDELYWCKNGKSIPVQYISTPLFQNNLLVGAVVTFNDITERKKSLERALILRQEEAARLMAEESQKKAEQQERKLTTILESITDAFFAIDNQWRFTYINSEAEKAFLILGQREANPIGKFFYDFMPEIKNTRFEIEYRKAMLLQRAVHFEEYFPPLAAWFNVHAYPSPEGLSVYFRNVTLQKRNEVRLQMLESVVTTANDAVLVTESYPLEYPGPAIIYVNDAFCRMTGWTAAEVLGREPRILQGQKTNKKITKKIRIALEKKKPVKVELQNYKKDGTEFWVEISIVPVFNKLGEVIYFTSVQRETTERRLAEETALRLVREEAALREAHQETRIRDEVLQVVAHDLRNPINAIVLGADMILKKISSESPRERKEPEIIKRSAERANSLIQDLLDVAKMQARSLTIKRQPLNTTIFLQEALELQRTLIENKNILLTTDIPANLPDLMADRDRMFQVISNLIGNAVKFTQQGGTISIKVRVENNQMILFFNDSGPGISEGQIPHLFDPFWQARQGSHEGAGLGLAICKGIVEAHGGKILVESQVNVGSTFIVCLPLFEKTDDVEDILFEPKAEDFSNDLFQ